MKVNLNYFKIPKSQDFQTFNSKVKFAFFSGNKFLEKYMFLKNFSKTIPKLYQGGPKVLIQDLIVFILEKVGLFFNNLFVIHQRYQNNRVYWDQSLLAFTSAVLQLTLIIKNQCLFARYLLKESLNFLYLSPKSLKAAVSSRV